MLKILSKIKQIIQKNRTTKITFWTVTLIISTILVYPLIGLILGLSTYNTYKWLKKHPNIAPIFQKLGALGMFLVVFFGLGIGINALPKTQTVPKTQTTSSVQSSQSASVNSQAKGGEQSKAIEQSKIEKEGQDKIKLEDEAKSRLVEDASRVNPDMDYGEAPTDNQQIEEAKSANTKIANFGFNTKGKKLFDVLAVVDGDTIKVSELGTLRLIGIDTPETKDPRKPVQCFGKEASQYAADNLKGKKVYLEFDPANRIDKYNRTLAYVYREDGYYYNLEAVKNGYAFAYTKYPNPRLEEFLVGQKEAREGAKGLWNSNTCNGQSKAAEVSKPAITIPIPVPIEVKQPKLLPVDKPKPVEDQDIPASSQPADSSDSDNPPVKLTTRSGLCHAKGSRGYGSTKHFTPYNSMQECLDAGGK